MRFLRAKCRYLYGLLAIQRPMMFLPRNLPAVILRPWGAKEFALKDNQLGIAIQQMVIKSPD
jgi:hypothetical protein